MRTHRPLLSILLLATCAAAVAACHESNVMNEGSGGGEPVPDPAQSLFVSDVPPPPLSGGTLTITADGTKAIVSDPDRDRVLVVDLEKRVTLGQFDTPERAQPGRSVEGERDVGYVALRRAGVVVSVDLETGAPLVTTPVCAAPRGLAFERASRLLHVACATGELVSFSTPLPHAPDRGRLTPARTLRLGSDLRDVVPTDAGLLVSHFRSASVDLVKSTGDVVTGRGAGPSSLGVRIFEPTAAWRLVSSQDGGAIMIHQQARGDTIQSLDSAPIVSGPSQTGVTASSSGSGGPDLGTYGGSCPDVAVHSEAAELDAEGQYRRRAGAGSLASMPLPIDIAVSRLGGFVAVLSAGSDRVLEGPRDVVLGGDACSGFDLPLPPPSNGPAAPSGNGGRLIPSSPEPIALAYDAHDGIVVQIREPSSLEVHAPSTGAVIASISLGGADRRDTAHRMFHGTPDGPPLAITCASCHPEGGDDGHVFHFLDGDRRTISLAGFSPDTAPFHWRGDLADGAQLVDSIYSGRMGAGLQSRARKGALVSWLATIAAPASPGGIDPDAAARGQALFEDATVGCATCHSGPRFTDDRTVDVATGGPFQVPSLIGVASHPPFMHDGCATTLEDRFLLPSCGGGDAHGHTSQLDEGQIHDLVAYMSTL
jgi:mono/diheme cytochrome c family protein